MTKKDYILKVLDALTGIWPLARGLKILVENNELDDNTTNTLVDVFSATINEILTTEAKEKLQKSKDILEKIKTIEREQHNKDQKEVENLDIMLQAL